MSGDPFSQGRKGRNNENSPKRRSHHHSRLVCVETRSSGGGDGGSALKKGDPEKETLRSPPQIIKRLTFAVKFSGLVVQSKPPDEDRKSNPATI
jgi:hypothetical protein